MTQGTPDPVLVSSRREALVIGGLFFVAMTYTITVCWKMGYDRDPATLRFILGFPDWVFYGIVIPWAACVLASFALGSLFMKDEVLEDGEEFVPLTLADEGTAPAGVSAGGSQ